MSVGRFGGNEPWALPRGAIEPPPFQPAEGSATIVRPAPAARAAATPPPEPAPRDAREALAGQMRLLVTQPGKTDDEARRIVVGLLWQAGRGNVAAIVNAPRPQAAAALDEALAKANPGL